MKKIENLIIKPEDVQSRVTYIHTAGEFAYLELTLGPIKQRGYLAQPRFTKKGEAWVKITAPKNKSSEEKSHTLIFIENDKWWKLALERLTSAYEKELEKKGSSVEQAAEMTRKEEHNAQ